MIIPWRSRSQRQLFIFFNFGESRFLPKSFITLTIWRELGIHRSDFKFVKNQLKIKLWYSSKRSNPLKNSKWSIKLCLPTCIEIFNSFEFVTIMGDVSMTKNRLNKYLYVQFTPARQSHLFKIRIKNFQSLRKRNFLPQANASNTARVNHFSLCAYPEEVDCSFRQCDQIKIAKCL